MGSFYFIELIESKNISVFYTSLKVKVLIIYTQTFTQVQ